MSRLSQRKRVACHVRGESPSLGWANVTRLPVFEWHARNRHRNTYLLGWAILVIGLIASAMN